MADKPDLELTLAIMSGPDDGRKVRFRYQEGDGSTDPSGNWVLTLGRRDDCDLCLPFDTQISRLHARLKCDSDGRWMLEDGGSRNGTFVEKRRVEGDLYLDEGVMFRIGRTWLRMEKTDR
jgi:adenylate cyclase